MRHNAVVPFIGTDAMALGFLLGARSFKTADPAAFRRRVLALLAVLALPTGLQGLLMLTA